jgi:hypothetical protein
MCGDPALLPPSKIYYEEGSYCGSLPNCSGVRCSQFFLVATLFTPVGIIPTYRKKRFSTFNNSILAFKQWLVEYNCFDVAWSARQVLRSNL